MDSQSDNRSFILSSDHIDSTDLQHVDADTRDRLQALLQAAGKSTQMISVFSCYISDVLFSSKETKL